MERSNHYLRLGLLTDAMPERSLDEVVGRAGQTGLIQALEIGTGGYSPSPHCDAEELLSKAGRPKQWRQRFDRAEIGISALNVSGNPLHPDPETAKRHNADLRRAVQLAAEPGVNRIVATSGCPGAAATDRSAPHFSGGGWLPDLERIADWQWRRWTLWPWSERLATALVTSTAKTRH